MSLVTSESKIVSMLERLTTQIEKLETEDHNQTGHQRTLATPEATHVLDLFRARPHILRLSVEATSAPRKLTALCAPGQAHEGSDKALTSNNQRKIPISPTGPKGCFHLQGSVGGKPVSFLIDTGVGVSLIAADVWESISRDNQTALEPWSGITWLE